MRGLILAGGYGTRLSPLTRGVNKQLLPVYDKPMIYYPLSILMLAGLRDILVISTPEVLGAYRALLGSGELWGLRFGYREQKEPRGLAEALLIGREFLAGGPSCLILGDNVFFGHGLPEQIRRARSRVEMEGGAVIFAYGVRDPQRYGVVEFEAGGEDPNPRAISIEEKPARPRSHYAVPGIYFYDKEAVTLAAKLRPSSRNELEITDLNNSYLKKGELRVEVLGRGIAWLDAGTPEALLQASNFVQTVQERQGMMISSPEEIAYRLGYIDRVELARQAKDLPNRYGEYLTRLAETEA